jgi:hypothetical protein
MRTDATEGKLCWIDRVAGHLATGGLGLIVGSVLSAVIIYYRLRGPESTVRGPFEVDAFRMTFDLSVVVRYGLPLGAAIAGLALPLGRVRSALSRITWAFIFDLMGLVSFFALDLWAFFLRPFVLVR